MYGSRFWSLLLYRYTLELCKFVLEFFALAYFHWDRICSNKAGAVIGDHPPCLSLPCTFPYPRACVFWVAISPEAIGYSLILMKPHSYTLKRSPLKQRKTAYFAQQRCESGSMKSQLFITTRACHMEDFGDENIILINCLNCYRSKYIPDARV